MQVIFLTLVAITSHPTKTTKISNAELHLRRIQLPLAHFTLLVEPEMMTGGRVLRHLALNITSLLSPLIFIITNQYHNHTSSPAPDKMLKFNTLNHVKATHWHPHRSHPRPYLTPRHMPISSFILSPFPFSLLTLLRLPSDFNQLRSLCPIVELRRLLLIVALHIANPSPT